MEWTPELSLIDDEYNGTIADWEAENRDVKHTVYGRLEPCGTCGKPKSEYVDLGRKGVYRCWWCNHRAAGTPE